MAANYEHLFVESNHDGLKLGVEIITPKKKKASGVVQLVHGMCEHKERYYHFCEYLTSLGYATIIHDHRGHGESVKSENDFGYFYSDGARGMVDDAHQITLLMKERYPDLPYFLFGHSMGSLVVRDYLKNYDFELDGLVVCGSPSNPVISPAAKLAIKELTRIKGDHFRPEKITDLGIGFFNFRFDNVTGSNEWICSNQDVREAQSKDPLCTFTFTLNGYENLMTLVSEVYSKKGWRLKNPLLPVFFISGSDDPCMVSRGKLIEAVGFLQYAGYENVSYRIYKGMRHELYNETEKEKVFEDIKEKLELWTYLKNK